MSNDTTISIVELEGDETSDENLMIAHQAGDARAFPMLLERYRSDLHRYLQRFLGSASAADDVFQETFLQIHLSAASFDVTRKLRPWLYTIASNKARDWYRHHKRRAALSLDKTMGHGDTEFTLLDVVASTDSQPGDSMSSLEESTRVKKVVDALRSFLSSFTRARQCERGLLGPLASSSHLAAAIGPALSERSRGDVSGSQG